MVYLGSWTVEELREVIVMLKKPVLASPFRSDRSGIYIGYTMIYHVYTRMYHDIPKLFMGRVEDCTVPLAIVIYINGSFKNRIAVSLEAYLHYCAQSEFCSVR